MVGVLQDAQTPREGLSVAVTSIIAQSVFVPPTSTPILYEDAAMMLILRVFLSRASSRTQKVRQATSYQPAIVILYQRMLVQADIYQ